MNNKNQTESDNFSAENLSLMELRAIAKELNIKNIIKYRKSHLAEIVKEAQSKPEQSHTHSNTNSKTDEKDIPAELSRMPLLSLRKQAGALGIKSAVRYRKNELIEMMAEAMMKNAPENEVKIPENKEEVPAEVPKAIEIAKEEIKDVIKEERAEAAKEIKKEAEKNNKEETKPPQSSGRIHHKHPKADYLVQLDSGIARSGILELMTEGYGFLRVDNYLSGSNDIYVSPAQIRRFNLKTGDLVKGNIRIPKENEKFKALLYVTSVNGDDAGTVQRRPNFEDLTPIYPEKRMTLEAAHSDLATRLIDLAAPIGLGQRGMIVSPPKAGKTVLLKKIAKSILTNHQDVQLIVLLIDERPEEVTDMQRSIASDRADVVYSTFDEQPEHHKKVAEMVLERAKRLVEQGKNLVVLLDSITRLSRAYNLTMPPGGRTLSGGLDPAALYMPKKFFGAARNIENGGSLTILATALVDTGSKMDDVIFEEFKGTGNMELVLDRRLSEKRIFPAIDINKSGTRREEILLSQKEMDALYTLRKRMGNTSIQEFNEQVTDILLRTKNNSEFVDVISSL